MAVARRDVVFSAGALGLIGALGGTVMSEAKEVGGARLRAREIGLAPGVLSPGPLNAITDVAGVRVGQVTRIGGVAREISVPVDHVIAIYARENGQGMAFPVPTPLGGQGVDSPASATVGDDLHLVDGEVHDDGAVEPEGSSAPGLRLAPAQKGGSRSPVKAVDRPAARNPEGDGADSQSPEPPEPPSGGGGRPALRRVK